MAGKFEKKEIPITMKVSDSIKRKLDAICEDQDRPMSYVARELMCRGLALYEKDGRLRDSQIDGVPVATAGTKIPIGKTHTQAKRKAR